MNSKSKYAVLLISSVLVIYAIIGGMLGRVSAQNGSYQQLSIFTEVLSRIQNDYVDDPNMKNAVDGAIRGLIENVDPYGGYLTPKDVAFYKDYVANPHKTPGIGAVLAKPARLGYPVIISTIPGGPAAKAGLNSGDIIESIDGITTREMNLVQINADARQLRRQNRAALSVIRSTTEPIRKRLMCTREVVPAPASRSEDAGKQHRLREGSVTCARQGSGSTQAAGCAFEERRDQRDSGPSIHRRRRRQRGIRSCELVHRVRHAIWLSTSQGQKQTKEALNADPKAGSDEGAGCGAGQSGNGWRSRTNCGRD